MHADRRPDLVNGHTGDGIALFLQDGQGLVTEGQAFFLIIAVAHCETVTFNSQPAFLHIYQQQVQRFSLALFSGACGTDIQCAACKSGYLADAPAVF